MRPMGNVYRCEIFIPIDGFAAEAEQGAAKYVNSFGWFIIKYK